MRLAAFSSALGAAVLMICQGIALAVPSGQHVQSSPPAPDDAFAASRLFDLPEFDTAQIANQMSLRQIAAGSRFVNVPDAEIPPVMRLGAGQAKRAQIILDLSYLARQTNPGAPAFKSDAFILKLKTEFADGRKYVNYYEAEQAMRAAMSILNQHGTLDDKLFYDENSLKGMAWCTRDFLTKGKLREEHARGLDGIAGAFRRAYERESDLRANELSLWMGGISAREALLRMRRIDLVKRRVCDDSARHGALRSWARILGTACAKAAGPAMEDPDYVVAAASAGLAAGAATGLGIAVVPSALAGAFAGAVSAEVDLLYAESAHRRWARRQMERAGISQGKTAMKEAIPPSPGSLPREVLEGKLKWFSEIFSDD
ncbi:MAG: hypothetical protein ACI4NA_00650 [Succinivibrio sp.]